MEIRSNSTPNFKATRVLTVQKNFQRKAPEIIDVFRLNKKEDLAFAEIGLATLNTRANILNKAGKSLRNFLRNFINDTGETQEYLLAVKNGETVVGGSEYFPLMDKVCVNKTFSPARKSLVADTLYHQILSDSEKIYEKDAVGAEIPKMFATDKLEILKNEMPTEKLKIEERNPKTTFEVANEEKINLNKFLGIDEFNLPQIIE